MSAKQNERDELDDEEPNPCPRMSDGELQEHLDQALAFMLMVKDNPNAEVPKLVVGADVLAALCVEVMAFREFELDVEKALDAREEALEGLETPTPAEQAENVVATNAGCVQAVTDAFTTLCDSLEPIEEEPGDLMGPPMGHVDPSYGAS